jgi:hypothetical protein
MTTEEINAGYVLPYTVMAIGKRRRLGTTPRRLHVCNEHYFR